MFSCVGNDQLLLCDSKVVTFKLQEITFLKDYWIDSDYTIFRVYSLINDELVHVEQNDTLLHLKKYTDTQFYDTHFMYEMKDGKLTKTPHNVRGSVVHITQKGDKLVNNFQRNTRLYIENVTLDHMLRYDSLTLCKDNTLFIYDEQNSKIIPLHTSEKFKYCDTFEKRDDIVVTFNMSIRVPYVELWDLRFMKEPFAKIPDDEYRMQLVGDYLFTPGSNITYRSIYNHEIVHVLNKIGNIYKSPTGVWIFDNVKKERSIYNWY